MRRYELNSPQAAARIVALTMLADGAIGQRELDVLQRFRAAAQLGLHDADLRAVLIALCEDLLVGANPSWAGAHSIDALSIARLLDEVDDADLRERVLALSLAVAEADETVSDGEAFVLTRAVEQWGLQARMFQLPSDRLAA